MMVVNLKYNYFVETSQTALGSYKTGKQVSTSSCQENLESQEQNGVPILKNGSQSHFSVNCVSGGGGDDEDDIWREVIYACNKNILNSSMRIVELFLHFIYLNGIVFNRR
jgi:hypothetical protein